MKKLLFVVHPLLFAMFFILALYSANVAELSLSSLWIPLIVALGFSLLFFILSCLLFRDPRKAAIVTSIVICIFFIDGHISSILEGWGWARPAKYLPVAWALLLIGVVYLTIRTKRKLYNLNTILSFVGVFLIVIPSISIAVYEFGRPSYSAQIEITGVAVEPSEVGTFPDIYYIILDGYSSSTTLKELYNYDNGAFTDYLSEKGFYIANESTSNYACTTLSLPSSLNMEYINYLSEVVGEQSKDTTIPRQMVQNNKVMTFLHSMGYQYVHFETWNGVTGHNAYADLSITYDDTEILGMTAPNELVRLLIETTILHRFTVDASTSTYRGYVLNAFDTLAEMPELPGPKFVFSHIICPHWPYVFGADGETIEVVSWMIEPTVVQRPKYLDQVKFINKKVEIVVNEILSKSQNPPIIILQADHGSRLCCDAGFTDTQCMQDTMRIFNAYYLPYGGDEVLYNSISPVNTFRVVFNFYFGADYELLSDQSYDSNIFEAPYAFVNVTDIVRYD